MPIDPMLCRICGSDAEHIFSRKFDLEVCNDCHDWVESQPAYYPPGTELVGEPVRWWDLRNLMYRGKDRVVGSHPLTTKQMVEFLKNAPLRLKVTALEMMAWRAVVKGMCVEAGIRYEGYPEEVAEEIFARADVEGHKP